MQIHIDPHMLERAEQRGTNAEEIIDVINSGSAIPGEYGRLGRAKVYDFGQTRYNNYYPQKRVEVYYVWKAKILLL